MSNQKPEIKARQSAEQRGRTAEMLAAMLLRVKGYRICEQRYRCPAGEIDIIAQKRDLCIFVEVKARKNIRDANESVTLRQRQRIEKAAEVWLQNNRFEEFSARFDVIAVVPGRLPSHMVDAWRPGW